MLFARRQLEGMKRSVKVIKHDFVLRIVSSIFMQYFQLCFNGLFCLKVE